MTAQILAAELGNLIQDSKRKNTELRNAAEKSLQDLKSLPQTSEIQLSADISRRPHFISPFLIACGTHNAKFASTGVSCLQRLSVFKALPKERLSEVVEAFKESASSSHDIQLKVLQALPSLLQNYPAELRGDLLSTVLQICSGLQNAKNFAVSNTAAATLQQLVITVFDKVVSEDERALEIPIVTEVKGDNGPISVRPAANDAYKMFNDLVLLVVGEKPLFMRFSPIPAASTLELIEAVLSNHEEIVSTHEEQIYLLRTLLMPLIIRSLSDRLSFPVTVRIVRILNLIVRNHLDILISECEIALGLLNHMLDPEASQLWKRALCLEVFRGIYADPRLLLSIFTHYDAIEGKKDIFGDNLAAFVRLAVEKPALIGLGQQSSVPTNLDDSKDSESDHAVAEAGALAGVISGPVTDSNSSTRSLGISSQWSSLKTPCIEHLDKSEPPSIPDTYIYSLVLTSITNISDSLAKFILPLTVHHETKNRKKKVGDVTEADNEDLDAKLPRLSRSQSFRTKTIPVNPLDLTNHSAYPYVEASSTLVTECWPAVLATCSTFLNAALDTDYYRALIRAIQKFTQVSGLLRLSTPRDAFLTTLVKAAVPSSLMITSAISTKTSTNAQSGIFSNAKALLSVDSLASQSSSVSTEATRRPSHDITVPTLSPRNLLCLRALLNLAIALGPTLQSAWSIVFETLQVADLVMALSSQSGARSSSTNTSRIETDSSEEKLGAETSAVQAAARRLFESTVDYPDESFSDVLKALCALLNHNPPSESGQQTPKPSSRPQMLHQRRLGSVSGFSTNTATSSRDSAFALNKIGELAALNEARLSQHDPTQSGWDTFVDEIVRFSADDRNSTSTRLLAADILSRTIREIAEISIADEQCEDIQARILLALQRQITALHPRIEDENFTYSDTDIRVHQIALEALKSVIEQCGESLVAGWNAVLGSLMSVFPDDVQSTTNEAESVDVHKHAPLSHSQVTEVISRSLTRSAFATLHLVCSDFLAAVPDTCLPTLLDLLLKFCCQREELNISLTAITFLWNVSDFLHSRSDLSILPKILGNAREQQEIREILNANSQDRLVPTLWIQVLLNLSSITTDERTEVRNSAIQTVQRIFQSYDEQLSSEVWMLCLRTIVFGMVQANIKVQRDQRAASDNSKDIESWNETSQAVLNSVSVLTAMCVEKLDSSQLSVVWSELLTYLQQYFECGSHALGSSVFSTITSVLSNMQSADILGMPSLLKTADVWKVYLDKREKWNTNSGGNQGAFVAYADAFMTIYRLAGRALDPQIPTMLANLEVCITSSDVAAYSSDIDKMTALQSRIMDCLSMINTDSPGLPSDLIQLLGRFTMLPYTASTGKPEQARPTFVALAKAAMTLLQATVIRHVESTEIYTSGAFLSALHSLAKPMQEKYSWHLEGKAPTLWQKAATTAISISEKGLSHLDEHKDADASFKETWITLIHIAHYITRAQLSSIDPPPASLAKDEAFDIGSFTQLRKLITWPLGSASIPDALRREYARNLFSISLLHATLPGELPDLTKAPLDNLYKIRHGQTAVLEPTWRTEMSYTCLSELFQLLSVRDSSPTQVKMAQAAAPYLILRAALPLKTYVADQSLRGRMPQPDVQRCELLFILTELKKLACEPQAIPNTPGVKSKHRKHLHRLFPLLNKASRVAKHDSEVFENIICLMEMVSDEFGLQEDE